MLYEKALEKWGAKRLTDAYWAVTYTSVSDVLVKMELVDEIISSRCDCFSEPASAYIVVTGVGIRENGRRENMEVRLAEYEFDFVTFLKEVCENAGGTISMSE